MLFRTRPDFEFKFGTYSEWLGDPPGTQHWRAFEWVFHDLWFIIEFLTEDGTGEDRRRLWKTICCTELLPVIDLAHDRNVLDHRLSVVTPPYASVKRQIELKPIQLVYSCGKNAYEVITSDGSQYNWPKDSTSTAPSKRKIYFRQSADASSPYKRKRPLSSI